MNDTSCLRRGRSFLWFRNNTSEKLLDVYNVIDCSLSKKKCGEAAALLLHEHRSAFELSFTPAACWWLICSETFGRLISPDQTSRQFRVNA